MNRITAISLLTIGSLASCAGAIAQQPAMKANIPFAFAVGNTWLPAGEYTISSPVREVIEFQSADHANLATVVSVESHDESTSGGSKLVFERYGNQYFLHRVLCPTVSQLNLDVAAGKVEKAARKRSLEAKNPDNGQTLVAAR